MTLQKQLLNITEDLVRIPSTTDRPEELQRILAYVEDFFLDCSSLTVKKYVSGNKPSLVISTVDTLSPDIMLVGHLDVVPASDDLFVPRYDGTKLYGRGVCDMKSECAVLMQLMKDLSQQVDCPSVALMFTTDEEIGGQHGVNYLLNEIGYRCRVALIPDGGQSPTDIVLTNKGVLHVRLTAQGKTGHGARPWLGENAIDKLLAAYQRVCSLFLEPVAGKDVWSHSCNIGVIQSGVAANQVPDVALCELDIRFTEGETSERMLQKLKEQVGDEVDVKVHVTGEPIHTDPSNTFVQTYAMCVKEVAGSEPVFNKHCGSNDGRYFTSHGIPVIVSRPISGDQHSPHEWLEIESLPVFYQICRKAIGEFKEKFF